MKTYKFSILIFIFFCTLPLFAQQQWYFSVDEYQKPNRNHLQGKSRILLVNNALEQPQDFGHSTYMDGESQSNIALDLSKSIIHCLFSATRSLDISGEFDAVELLEITQNSSTNYYTRTPLTSTKVQQLMIDYQADALLVLNQLVLYDVLESFLTDRGTYYAYLQAFAQSHWTMYCKGESGKVQTENSFTQADTLLWESREYYNRTQSLNDLPHRQEALLYLASELGSRFADSFLPSWNSARRYVYELESLQHGLERFRYQKWQEAITSWRHILENSKDKKTAACAAANIAIAYEMMSDYSSAYAYAQKAFRLFGVWKTAYGRQQQVNMRYYQAQLQAKMEE